ncbi:MAG: YfiR family protein [Bacteroidales bacterium]|nr:YfiR family protein [Bacteroidales bacterium]
MKRFWITLCAVFVFTTAYMQNTIPRAQTLFIYNFCLLTEWPDGYRTGPFIIGVLGDSEITGELESYMSDRKVGSQNIRIVQFNASKDITRCHILFVPFSKTRMIPEISRHLAGKSTLLVTERSGALDAGSAINFVIVREKMKFEVRTENADKYGISLSSELQEMAALAM